MLKRILLSFIFVTPSGFAMMPDLGISTATCCIYATMSCLCCSNGLQICCKEHEYNKIRGDIKDIKNSVSRLTVKLIDPQPQRMAPYILPTQKQTSDQANMAGISCLTPPIPRTSLDGRLLTPPLTLKETE